MMEQISIFDLDEELLTFKIDIDKPIRLISLFSGYDSQKLAFNYLGIDVEHYRAVEFDKYAIQSLNDIHNTNFSPLDITKVKGTDLGIYNTTKYTYVMTYSFPCTDLSLAGKRAGMEKGKSTRSGLLWEVERLLNEVDNLPQIMIMENVPQVLSANGWREWILFLESKGYSNYAEILNAKKYGIPQNRERCFMVSILGKYNYKFPKGFELKYRLKDLLESNVDESYYLSDNFLNYCLGVNQKESKFPRKKRFLQSLKMTNEKGIATTISTSTGNRPVDNFIIPETTKRGFAVAGDVVQKGMVQTLKTSCADVGVVIGRTQKNAYVGTGNQNGIIIIRNENEPKVLGGIGEKKSNGGTQWYQQDRIYDNNVAISVTTSFQPNYLAENLRIRKLIPKECFKLMGVKPSDYEKLTVSKNQKYKQAGNSIVTTCLMAIYSQLFENFDYKKKIDELLEELIV